MTRSTGTESTSAQIAGRIRDDIMAGTLPAGARLTEAALAAQFDVSRGPLREAMQRLVSEGLLRSERNRGLFVIDLEPTDVHDIYAARLLIESEALRRMLRRDPADVRPTVDAMREAINAMSAAEADGDPIELAAADLRFHEELVAGSGSKRLVRMARTLLAETCMCLAALGQNQPRRPSRTAEHAQILAMIERGRRAHALADLEAHMNDALHRLAPGFSLSD